MHIYLKDEVDPTRDYQLVNCGGGLSQTYALGRKTGSYQIGEIALKLIESKLEFLSERPRAAAPRASAPNMSENACSSPIDPL